MRLNPVCKQLVALLFLTSSLWGFRPYLFNDTSAKNVALSVDSAPGFYGPDAFFCNPSLLGEINRTILAYEFEASLRFSGLRFDYQLAFQAIGGLGVYLGGTESSPSKFPFAISYQHLFKAPPIAKGGKFELQSFEDSFIVRKVSFIKSFPLGNFTHLGVNVGPAIGFDSGRISIFPSFVVGANSKIYNNLDLAFTFSSPLNFDWQNGITESTPFDLNLGVNWKFDEGFRLLGELSYEGWDFISYKRDGREFYIDKGLSYFDINQNIFPSIGIYYKGFERTISYKIPEDPAAIRERLNEINLIKRELDIAPGTDELQTNLNLANEKLKSLYKRQSELQVNDVTEEQNLKGVAIRNRNRELRTQLKKLEVSLTNDTILFRDKSELLTIQKEIDALKLEQTSNNQFLTDLRTKKLSDEQALELRTIQNELIELRNIVQRFATKEREARQNYITKRKTLYAKGQRNIASLTEEEKKIYQTEVTYRELEKERRLLNENSKKNRGGRSTFEDGEYYLSFKPTVQYRPNGTYLKNGTIAVGFSFIPANIKNLYITITLEDRVILGLLGVFPENDLVETFRISTDFIF